MAWSVEEWNAFLTGLCFFLVFSGWSAVSNILTSTRGDVGSYALSIVYLTLTISNLITAKLISKYSPKHIMLFGSMTYAICIATNISHFPPIILYVASFLVGVGAAAIWVAQQIFVTQCSNYFEMNNNLELNSKLGYFNGLFYMIYNFKKIIGPAIGAVSLSFGASVSAMYSILTFLCLIGGLGFLLLKPMKEHENDALKNDIDKQQEVVGLLDDQSDTDNHEENDNEDTDSVNDTSKINEVEGEKVADKIETNNNEIEPQQISLKQSIYKIFELWQDIRLWQLVPFTIFCGLDASFISGVFPLLIQGTKSKFYIISYCGICLSVSSMIVGKLSDKIGRISVLIMAGFFEVIMYSYVISIDFDDVMWKQQIPLWHILTLGAFIGISGSTFLTQLSSIYPTILKSRAAPVFANLKLFQSLFQAIAFYIQSIISIHSMTKLNCAMLICGLLPLMTVKSIRDALQKTDGS